MRSNGGKTTEAFDMFDRYQPGKNYMDFFPALSIYGIVKSQIRDFGFKSSSDIDIEKTWVMNDFELIE